MIILLVDISGFLLMVIGDFFLWILVIILLMVIGDFLGGYQSLFWIKLSETITLVKIGQNVTMIFVTTCDY